LVVSSAAVRADNVLDWNLTMRQSIIAVPDKANPGLSTRAIGMMNAAIYDVYQAFDHTYQPFLAKNLSADLNANRDAAVARAARDILENCYPEASGTWLTAYNNRINAIADSTLNIANGAALGAVIAHKYIEKHANDGFDAVTPYTPQVGVPGHWNSDPYFMTGFGPAQVQTGWGPGWGNVTPWSMTSPDQFDSVLVDKGGVILTSAAYANAYNQVLNYGAKTVYGPANTPTSRTSTQTAISQFWGYDVGGFGPPPVLFLKNLEDIATQTNNTPEQNARLFAMASVAIADAAIAAWDVKFEEDFWRPVTAIHAAATDGNAATEADTDWEPLGAPGHGIISPDFTPAFPAYTSGHATMGGALFKAIELFYGKNNFGDIIGSPGAQYSLSSDEPGGGGTRLFSSFTESDLAAMAASLNADSPEGENSISRLFLGIHWIFDATDGIRLGNAIAQNMFANHFQLANVPEPSFIALAFVCAAMIAATGRRWFRKSGG
jgi:hypothetical protein